jgi:hypothetical protein
MDIKPLLDLSCAKVASMLKGKTPEQIRKQFNIANDFTPGGRAPMANRIAAAAAAGPLLWRSSDAFAPCRVVAHDSVRCGLFFVRRGGGGCARREQVGRGELSDKVNVVVEASVNHGVPPHGAHAHDTGARRTRRTIT